MQGEVTTAELENAKDVLQRLGRTQYTEENQLTEIEHNVLRIAQDILHEAYMRAEFPNSKRTNRFTLYVHKG